MEKEALMTVRTLLEHLCASFAAQTKGGTVMTADKDNVYLVDSGNDKDAGRKVRQILDKNGWHLTAILNTHSNADHIGGSRYLQGQTGCKIYSGGIEAAFTKYPVLGHPP